MSERVKYMLAVVRYGQREAFERMHKGGVCQCMLLFFLGDALLVEM